MSGNRCFIGQGSSDLACEQTVVSAAHADLASRVIDAVVPGHKLVSVTPAHAAFTNSVQVLDTLSPAGSRLRLVVKRMTDDPDPERATADFHGLRIARKHGIPAPEPVLLDATGELLGTPGIVTTFVDGTQNANPARPPRRGLRT